MADNKYRYYGHPSYNEIGSHPEERSKTSHVYDHKCKPVLVDAEGRKRPIISLPVNIETYVTRTETYIEEVYSSSDDEYKHSHTTKCEPVRYYGRPLDKGNRHSSPPHDRPADVNKFITKIQTEASQPMKYPRSPTYRRQSPVSRVQGNTDNDFNRPCDYYNKKIANKPTGYVKQHNKYCDDYNSDDDESEGDEKPHLITICGWSKPGHTTGLSAPHAYDTIRKPTNGIGTKESKEKGAGDWLGPTRTAARDAAPDRDARLSAPMNDIKKAIEYFKNAVNLHESGKAAPNSWNPAPPSNAQKRGGHTETIDSREAARRYGHYRPPVQENYTTTIDSREAARKYNGTAV